MSRRVKAGTHPTRHIADTDWLTELYSFLTTPTVGVDGDGGVGGGPSSVRFPDTVVFKYERPYLWFAHGPCGIVVRDSHKEIGSIAVLQAFTDSFERARKRSRGPHTEIVAYYVSSAGDNGRQSVEYFDLAALRDFLFNQKKQNGILQRFVPATGYQHSVIRVRWSRSHVEMEERTNHHKMADRSRSILDRAVTFDGSEHLSSWHPVMPSSRLAELCESTTHSLLQHVSMIVPTRYTVHSATLFLKPVTDKAIILLWCQHLVVQDEFGRLLPVEEVRWTA
jgi:hypothetical protein